MNIKFISFNLFVCIFICVGVCTGCKPVSQDKSPEQTSLEKTTISSSASNSIQTLLSSDIVDKLDSLDVKNLTLYNFYFRFSHNKHIKSSIARLKKVENLKNSFEAYQEPCDKFSGISTNDLCSYLAAEMDALTSDIYTPITSWETDKFLRFKRAQKLFHFVDYNDSDLLAMIPHFEKHLSTNGSFYLAVGGLLRTTTNGFPLLIKALDNESLGIQASILQALANNKIVSQVSQMRNDTELLEKSIHYLQTPPVNPFSSEDPHWLQNEIWIRTIRCAAISLLSQQENEIELSYNLIVDTAFNDPDPIIRCAALKILNRIGSRNPSLSEKTGLKITPNEVFNQVITNPKELPFIRYYAQNIVLDIPLKIPEVIEPMSVPEWYYQFPDEKTFIPIY